MQIPVESCWDLQWFTVAVLAFVFVSGKICCVCLRNLYLSRDDSCCLSFSFNSCFVSSQLSTSQLCCSEWVENYVGPVYSVLWGWRSWLLAPFFFWWEELFLTGKFLLSVEQWQFAGMRWCSQNKVVFFFLCDYSHFFLLLLLQLPKWTPEVSWNCFCSWIAVQ